VEDKLSKAGSTNGDEEEEISDVCGKARRKEAAV
jgi:hypothetical protein